MGERGEEGKISLTVLYNEMIAEKSEIYQKLGLVSYKQNKFGRRKSLLKSEQTLTFSMLKLNCDTKKQV